MTGATRDLEAGQLSASGATTSGGSVGDDEGVVVQLPGLVDVLLLSRGRRGQHVATEDEANVQLSEVEQLAEAQAAQGREAGGLLSQKALEPVFVVADNVVNLCVGATIAALLEDVVDDEVNLLLKVVQPVRVLRPAADRLEVNDVTSKHNVLGLEAGAGVEEDIKGERVDVLAVEVR